MKYKKLSQSFQKAIWIAWENRAFINRLECNSSKEERRRAGVLTSSEIDGEDLTEDTSVIDRTHIECDKADTQSVQSTVQDEVL